MSKETHTGYAPQTQGEWNDRLTQSRKQAEDATRWAENKTRHGANKRIQHGRHGSEFPLFDGQARGRRKYRTTTQPVVQYEIHLLSHDEVFYNLFLLDEKPQSPSDKIQSTRPVGKIHVTLFKNEQPIKDATVMPDQVPLLEELWQTALLNGLPLTDDIPPVRDETRQVLPVEISG